MFSFQLFIIPRGGGVGARVKTMETRVWIRTAQSCVPGSRDKRVGHNEYALPAVTVAAFKSYWATAAPDQWSHRPHKLCIYTANKGEI